MVEPKETELKDLLAYWEGKRGARAMPARADIDPIEIPQLLPHLIMVDTAETPEDFCYRLYGTEVCKGFEHDRTGLRFSEMPRIENYDEVYRGYWLTYTEKAPNYFHGQIVSDSRNYIGYSRLTLPLSSDGERVDKILGGVVFFYT
jgi:hypothetical protein